MENANLFLDVSTTLLGRGSCVRFRASGQSMQPTIQEGDIITVAPLKPSEVTRGDILLYRGDAGVIAHRVVAIKRSKAEAIAFILRGDASDTCDAPMQAEQLLGKVVGVERQGQSLILARMRVKMVRTIRVYASWLKRRLVGRQPSARR